MKYCAAFAILFALSWVATPGFAQETEQDKASSQRLSVTASVLHAALIVPKLSVEYALTDKFSAAAFGGYGSVSSIDHYQVGGSLRYYLAGDFRNGLQIGFEGGYVDLSADLGSTVHDLLDVLGIEGSIKGPVFGGFLGYKYIADFGLTFETQLGAQRFSTETTLTSKVTNHSETREDTVWGPLLATNLGWSF